MLVVLCRLGLGRGFKPCVVLVVPELIEIGLPIILGPWQHGLGVHASLRREDMCQALALTVRQRMQMSRGPYLHGPIFGGRFVDDLDLAVNVGKLHIFTLAHQEQLQGIRGGSKDCVCPSTEPVCMEHLPVLVFPECCDPAAVRQDGEETSHVTGTTDPTDIGYHNWEMENLPGTHTKYRRKKKAKKKYIWRRTWGTKKKVF